MKNFYTLLMLFALLATTANATVKPRHGRGSAQSEQTEETDGKHKSPKKVGSQATAPLKAKGSPKVPVILVQFSDKKFISGLGTTVDGSGNEVPNQCLTSEDEATVNAFFDKFCNGDGGEGYYTGAGSYGSINEYFRDQSLGQFTPEFVVIGPVTLTNSYSYYGKNNGTSKDINMSKFYSEAITAAQKIFSDWSQFDNDKDTKHSVDMAFFIFAGEGENGSSDSNTIWPHERPTGGTLNSVTFGCYACCNETYKKKTDGIGVFVHELSHALGLPDFYDKNYVAYGLDYWDIMDSGCYCNTGYIPCNYSAYQRDFMGWTPLVELTAADEGTQITLTPVSRGGIGYKIVNPSNTNEYFVIEARVSEGWDLFVGRGTERTKNHGLMMTHVNYNKSAWDSNNVNIDASKQRITIVPADGTLYSYMFVENMDDYNTFMISTTGDLFPGRGDVHEFSGSHSVTYTIFDWVEQKDPETGEVLKDPETGEKLWERVYKDYDWSTNDFGQPILDITENEDGTVTFYFKSYPTLIDSLFADTVSDAVIYNTAGQQIGVTDIEHGKPVNLPSTPGIYIVSGKKYIVR